MTTIQCKRGDTFKASLSLVNDDGSASEWLPADFTGGVFFTVREAIPDSSVVDDSAAICQVSTTPNASGVIAWESALGGVDGLETIWTANVTIYASVTRFWTPKRLLGEFRTEITGSPKVVPPIKGGGTVIIALDGDLKRS